MANVDLYHTAGAHEDPHTLAFWESLCIAVSALPVQLLQFALRLQVHSCFVSVGVRKADHVRHQAAPKVPRGGPKANTGR